MYSKAVLFVFALVYIALGVWCWSMPVEVAGRVGFKLVGDSGVSEFQVVYGGLELAIGFFLLFCFKNAQYQQAGLVFAVISSACLFGVRTISIALGGEFEAITYRLWAAELVIVILALSAWFTSNKSSTGVSAHGVDS
ncbi:MAG: DUF4345 family protein [Pseudomonadota bacterium]